MEDKPFKKGDILQVDPTKPFRKNLKINENYEVKEANNHTVYLKGKYHYHPYLYFRRLNTLSLTDNISQQGTQC